MGILLGVNTLQILPRHPSCSRYLTKKLPADKPGVKIKVDLSNQGDWDKYNADAGASVSE